MVPYARGTVRARKSGSLLFAACATGTSRKLRADLSSVCPPRCSVYIRGWGERRGNYAQMQRSS
eukprot:3877499-Prymnesium_polylepis.1